MNKAHSNINWENKPSDNTPINDANLNKMDKSIDEIDDRVITLDTNKATKTEISTLISDVEWDKDTGTITFTRKNGGVITLDTNLEKIAVNFSYDQVAEQLIITLDNGEVQYVDLSALITQYEFLDSDTIAFSVDSDGKVTAIVKEGSILEKHLQPDYLADIKVETAKSATSVANAQTAEESAASSAKNAAKSEENALIAATNAGDSATNAAASEITAVNASDSASASAASAATSADTATTKASEAAASADSADKSAKSILGAEESTEKNAKSADESAETAKTYSEQAKTSSDNAKASEDNAKSSEMNALTSETNAKESETNAKSSEVLAKTYADNAKQSEDSAKSSEDNALASETASKASETNAKDSETSAADYATKSQSYAVGGTSTRDGEDTDNAEYYYEQTKRISQGLNGVIPMGTVMFESLPTQDIQSGYMYNVSNAFTSDDRFADGGNKYYGAGNNVIYTADGKWDVLAASSVTGVKGDNESDYRQGNINITSENIGAANEINYNKANAELQLKSGNTVIDTTTIEIVESVIGVKGNVETDYRQGNVNLTAENIGAGNVLDYDEDNSKLYLKSGDTILSEVTIEGGGGGAVSLPDVSGATATATPYTVSLKWSDPDDVVLSGVTLAKWSGTLVVRKEGSAPSNKADGVTVVNSTTRNAYASDAFVDTDLENDNTYYYRFFPYSTDKKYTEGSSVSAVPELYVIEKIPTQKEALIYNGEEQTVEWNDYDSEQLTIGGDLSATSVGTYYTTFTPTKNYKWSDSTTETKTVSWTIAREMLTVIPSQSGTLTYNGEEQSPTWSNFDTDKLVIGGVTSETNAGTHIATFTPVEGYAWADGDVAKEVSWTMEAKSIAIPTVSGSFTYNASEKAATVSGLDETAVTQSGTASATNAGSYTITFSLNSTTNYVWSDGTTADKTSTWTIAKASGSATLSATSVTLDSSNTTATVTVSDGTGEISVESKDTTLCSATLADGVITITSVNEKSGNVNVVVTVAETENYKSGTWTIAVNCAFLQLVAWSTGTDEQIAAMVNAYYNGGCTLDDIKSVWSVGDTRTVSLSAMAATGVGESHRAQTVEYVIMDFEHDDLTTAINGHTKALISLNQKDCLMSSDTYKTSSYTSSDSEYGYMNSSNTNSGGWTSCARRTWCNNVYKAALPSYIQGLVKAVNKLTTAGSQSYTINTTSDYIWLPSQMEVGLRTTNSPYYNEGTTYSYYETSSNRYKRPLWGSTSSSCIWWNRSPYVGNSARFCSVNTDGTAGNFGASYTNGLAPCLCI